MFIMFRAFPSAAILALTVTAAQAADSSDLSSRVQAAAETACAVERFEGRPYVFHEAIFQACVSRLSNAAMSRHDAIAKAKAPARGRIANN